MRFSRRPYRCTSLKIRWRIRPDVDLTIDHSWWQKNDSLSCKRFAAWAEQSESDWGSYSVGRFAGSTGRCSILRVHVRVKRQFEGIPTTGFITLYFID